MTAFIRYVLTYALCLLLLTSANAVFSQASEFAFRHYTTDQGLSSDQTTCIFKDQQGYMWFGTVNGLNRFDGVQFTVYKRKEGGLPGNYIIGINQSPDGWLWISTHKGICRFNPLTEVFEPLALPNNTDERGDNDFVSGLVLDGKEYGWFATPDQLYRIHLPSKQLTAYPPVLQDPHPLLMYLFMDSQSQLWILRAGAVYRFDPETKQYTYFLGQDSRHRNSELHIGTLYEDSRRQLWASTFEKGLFRYDTQRHCFIDIPDGHTSLYAITEDWLPDGQTFFWASKSNNELATYNPVTQQYTAYQYDSRDALSHNGGGIAQFFRDSQGNVWMATDKGIQKKDPFEIKFKRKLIPRQTENSQDIQVGFVQQDHHQPARYWVGLSGAGLMHWDRTANTFTKINNKLIPGSWNVYDLVQGKNGQMWIGTDNALLYCNSHTDQWKRITDFFITPLAYQQVSTLYQDHSGQVWIGSSHDGLFVLNPETGQITPWVLADTIGVGNPMAIYKITSDHLKRIWVATNRGIFRIQSADSQTDQIQLHPLSKYILPSDRLQSSLFIDSKNRLWISGIGFLAQADLDGKVNHIYTQENGLQADHIYSIAEDHSGHLWMTTDHLMHRLDTKNGIFNYYRKENGLYANSSTNRLCKDASGELFVGFSGAFNHFVPEQLLYNTQAPPIVFTELKIDNEKRTIQADKRLEISPDENTLSIAFAGLNYSLPEKNQYAFKLEGFDKEWVYTDQRNATYTNLSPGSYTFRVKAANNDGIWNEDGMALNIQVIPPFWQTWWFILLVTGVMAGILLAIYRYRENNRLKLEAIRNRIATDLHDDMGSTLSSIRIFSDVVQKQIAPVQPEAVPILQRISASATGLSESMQDIIWTIQTRHDSLEDVITRMREFGLKIAEAKEIDFRMQVSDQFQTKRLSVEQRRNLYLIFKESINNAVKYAACTQILVMLEVSGRNLHLRISDNGKGFDPATVRQGNGLQNLQKRASEIHGKLTIQSAPGAGTSIDLQAKLSF